MEWTNSASEIIRSEIITKFRNYDKAEIITRFRILYGHVFMHNGIEDSS